MDLLGGYDSDADGDASDNEQQPPQNAGRAILTAPGPSPANNEENGPPHTAGLSRRGLFAALPPPKAKADGTPGGEGRGRSLFAALPPPKASSGRPAIVDLQSELSLSGTTKPPASLPRKKGVVQFRPPIDMTYLTKGDDRDNDTWQPPKKKGRTTEVADGAPAENKTSNSSFASFLPPPKNSLGAGNRLGGGAVGGRKMAMDTAVGSESLDESPRIQLDSVAKSTPSGNGGGAAVNGSAAVREDGVKGGSAGAGLEGLQYPVAEVHNQAGYVAPPQPGYAQDGAGPLPTYEQPGVSYGYQQPYQIGTSYSQNYVMPQYGGVDTWQPDGPPGGSAAAPPVDLLTAKLMEEEARAMRRGGGRTSGPQVVEVKQTDITTGTYRREDMLKTSTFGPQAQPVSSAKDAGPGKMERRKHQISSLYADMKKKEMEMVDSRATGMQTKAQTKGKYGW